MKHFTCVGDSCSVTCLVVGLAWSRWLGLGLLGWRSSDLGTWQMGLGSTRSRIALTTLVAFHCSQSRITMFQCGFWTCFYLWASRKLDEEEDKFRLCTESLIFLAFKGFYMQPKVGIVTCVLAESIAEHDDLIQFSPLFILNLVYHITGCFKKNWPNLKSLFETRCRVEKSKLRKTLFWFWVWFVFLFKGIGVLNGSCSFVDWE